MGPSTRCSIARTIFRGIGAVCLLATALSLFTSAPIFGAPAIITLDDSPGGRRQVIDGFGTCIGNDLGKNPKMQALYFDDLGASIVRMDLTPRFIPRYSGMNYISPWFYNDAKILTFPPGSPVNKATAGGPDHNNVRTYTGPADYSRAFGGRKAMIAVMAPDIHANIKKFNVWENGALAMFRAGLKRHKDEGDLKLYGSIWSPAPWVKEANGDVWEGGSAVMPAKGTPFPFIWGGNFSGGSVDVSGKPLEVFNDGTGPTSALTQFARSTAAYIKGIQDANHVHFHAISIQNEVNFPEFYNSCTYPKASQYIAAVKAIRAEFDKYDDLKTIRIAGPEDVLGKDAWALWQYGGGDRATCKNLQYLDALSKDPEAMNAIDLFCIHGYAPDGSSAVGADPVQWRWWADGWRSAPERGLPEHVKGFTAFNKRSWMTETSGEADAWLAPADGFPGNGGFSIALKIQQALTTGQQSAWIYWQFAEQSHTTTATLTGTRAMADSPKYVAAKHFYKFIRPDAVRIDTHVTGDPAVTASAFVHDTQHTLTIVLVNSSPNPQPATISIPAKLISTKPFDAYTSADKSLWRTSQAPVADGRVAVTVPGYGVVTLVATTP